MNSELINAVKFIIENSKTDIFPEDYLMEKDIEEGTEEEEFIYENFDEIRDYLFDRLIARIELAVT